jgi:hypothetical protein
VTAQAGGAEQKDEQLARLREQHEAGLFNVSNHLSGSPRNQSKGRHPASPGVTSDRLHAQGTQGISDQRRRESSVRFSPDQASGGLFGVPPPPPGSPRGGESPRSILKKGAANYGGEVGGGGGGGGGDASGGEGAEAQAQAQAEAELAEAEAELAEAEAQEEEGAAEAEAEEEETY